MAGDERLSLFSGLWRNTDGTLATPGQRHLPGLRHHAVHGGGVDAGLAGGAGDEDVAAHGEAFLRDRWHVKPLRGSRAAFTARPTS